MQTIYWLHTSEGAQFAAYGDLAAARHRGSELAQARDEEFHIVAVPVLETIANPVTDAERADRERIRAVGLDAVFIGGRLHQSAAARRLADEAAAVRVYLAKQLQSA